MKYTVCCRYSKSFTIVQPHATAYESNRLKGIVIPGESIKSPGV